MLSENASESGIEYPETSDVAKFKICLVGGAAVGKTSLIRRFVFNSFDDRYIATLGAKVTKKEVSVGTENPTRVLLLIWDIMGVKGFRDLLKEAYFHGAQGVIAVCDFTKKPTLDELPNWVDSVYMVSGEIPTSIVANKKDLVDSFDMDEKAVSAVASRLNSPHFLTSAKTGEGVTTVFEDIALRVLAAESKS